MTGSGGREREREEFTTFMKPHESVWLHECSEQNGYEAMADRIVVFGPHDQKACESRVCRWLTTYSSRTWPRMYAVLDGI